MSIKAIFSPKICY